MSTKSSEIDKLIEAAALMKLNETEMQSLTFFETILQKNKNIDHLLIQTPPVNFLNQFYNKVDKPLFHAINSRDNDELIQQLMASSEKLKLNNVRFESDESHIELESTSIERQRVGAGAGSAQSRRRSVPPVPTDFQSETDRKLQLEIRKRKTPPVSTDLQSGGDQKRHKKEHIAQASAQGAGSAAASADGSSSQSVAAVRIPGVGGQQLFRYHAHQDYTAVERCRRWERLKLEKMERQKKR